MTQLWRSLSIFAGRPITSKRDAVATHRQWIAKTGIYRSSIQEKSGHWHVVYRQSASSRATVTSFVADYLADLQRRVTPENHRNITRYLTTFAEWCRVNGIRRLTDITRRHVERFGAWLPERQTGTTQRRYLESIRAALNRAVDWELIPGNPAAKLRMPPNRTTFERRPLTDDEIRIVESWPTPVREWAMLGLWAGLRRSEATFLEWTDVDLDQGVIRVTAKPQVGFSPKGTRYRDQRPDVIPLVPWLADSIGKLPRTGRYVFDTGENKPRHNANGWSRIVYDLVRKTGLPTDVTPHTFRHTFCTRLALAGVNRAVLPRLARHLNAQTTDRYVHTALDDARREITKLQPV